MNRGFAVGLIAVGLLFGLWWGVTGRKTAPLVVYCAHDSVFSEKILRDFEARTGIRVAARFDTEATKSLGLVELLIREKAAPRCDVFWNNELLGTLDLAEQGLLLPYQGPGFARIPARHKAPDGAWTGFAARLRVWITNGPAVPATPLDFPAAGDLGQFAVAKPLYGTTLTHYAVLWDQLGGPALQAWHRDLRTRGVREVAGNAAVKDLVAAGVCAQGWTDTDDYFEAKDAGKTVGMQPVRLASGATIAIPNTVAIIRGSRQVAAAQQLVDFLLSAETELALARSGSRQIPLGPVVPEQLPEEVRELTIWAAQGADLSRLGPARAACLAWLKAEDRK